MYSGIRATFFKLHAILCVCVRGIATAREALETHVILCACVRGRASAREALVKQLQIREEKLVKTVVCWLFLFRAGLCMKGLAAREIAVEQQRTGPSLCTKQSIEALFSSQGRRCGCEIFF